MARIAADFERRVALANQLPFFWLVSYVRGYFRRCRPRGVAPVHEDAGRRLRPLEVGGTTDATDRQFRLATLAGVALRQRDESKDRRSLGSIQGVERERRREAEENGSDPKRVGVNNLQGTW